MYLSPARDKQALRDDSSDFSDNGYKRFYLFQVFPDRAYRQLLSTSAHYSICFVILSESRLYSVKSIAPVLFQVQHRLPATDKLPKQSGH